MKKFMLEFFRNFNWKRFFVNIGAMIFVVVLIMTGGLASISGSDVDSEEISDMAFLIYMAGIFGTPLWSAYWIWKGNAVTKAFMALVLVGYIYIVFIVVMFF